MPHVLNQLEIFDPLIVEFFLTTSLLFLIILCIFLLNIQETSKIINNDVLFSIILFCLTFSVILSYFAQSSSIVILNGILIYDELTKFIHSFLIFCLIIYFILQQKHTLTKNYNYFENNIIILISVIGMMILCSTYNLIILYLAIELQSLSFYILAGSKRNSPVSTEAALKYFILGTIGSGLILYGISIIYGITGSLNLGNIFLLITHINQFEYLSFLISFFYAFLFLSTGLLFKIGAAPFHTWLPDVYEGSPKHITMFFSILPKITLISLLIRLFFDIGEDILIFFSFFFYFCSLFSIFIGALVALQQKKIKRLLAYSSISHIGFILIGFTVGTYKSIEFILFYLIIYVIMSFNIWSIFLAIQLKNNSLKYITSFTNFSKINPILSIIILLNLFSLAGVPPLAGFFSKAFIFSLAIKNSFIGLSILAILLSIISAFYYLRLIKILFFEKTKKIEPMLTIAKSESIIILLTSQFLCFYFIFPQYILSYIEKIVLFFII